MPSEIYWENGERVSVVEPEYEEAEGHEIQSPVLEMMRTLVGVLKSCHDPRLTIECLALITGICYDGRSMSEIAASNLVTRATVSRRCVDLCKQLGIPPVRAMRNESGQVNCRKAQMKINKELVDEYLP